MSSVISVLASCCETMKKRKEFNPIENKAFYEFLYYATKREDNIRIRLNLLEIRFKLYIKKMKLSMSEELWLLAYLEGALLNHEEFV